MAGRSGSLARRVLLVCAAAAPVVVASALPAAGQSSFPVVTNALGSESKPYPAGQTITMKMAVPFGQESVLFNGRDNTTVEVAISFPTGWTNPGCGEARTENLDMLVSGWNCAAGESGGRSTLRWTGPQIPAGKTAADSAQYFTFAVTTASPSALTTYGKGSVDGFLVAQKYAQGETSTWKTPSDTGPGVVANGMVRSVAAVGAVANTGTTTGRTDPGSTAAAPAVDPLSPPADAAAPTLIPPPPPAGRSPVNLGSPTAAVNTGDNGPSAGGGPVLLHLVAVALGAGSALLLVGGHARLVGRS